MHGTLSYWLLLVACGPYAFIYVYLFIRGSCVLPQVETELVRADYLRLRPASCAHVLHALLSSSLPRAPPGVFGPASDLAIANVDDGKLDFAHRVAHRLQSRSLHTPLHPATPVAPHPPRSFCFPCYPPHDALTAQAKVVVDDGRLYRTCGSNADVRVSWV